MLEEISSNNTVPYINAINVISYLNGWISEIIPSEDDLEKHQKDICQDMVMKISEELLSGLKEDPSNGTIIWIPKSECGGWDEIDNL